MIVKVEELRTIPLTFHVRPHVPGDRKLSFQQSSTKINLLLEDMKITGHHLPYLRRQVIKVTPSPAFVGANSAVIPASQEVPSQL